MKKFLYGLVITMLLSSISFNALAAEEPNAPIELKEVMLLAFRMKLKQLL